ncbi:MAG: TonB-dependent receptor [Gammaproteobacteria bacterium]|nr:TonB-dependent receptor [Gammaproteobacteria bacterium]MBU2058558.1 TonB-dependent receptor [Gammaproteobacteria bacterium]MBU2175583.1 TonB-dependent receptor [Gammaproteobacteria bacterium]MBU2248669.1 TonB-dependent receptor [Gammaproteobacteria bacterium]MBU2344792.1 TonB-dependent receptor [Gammaproteobacteria bacterium]
MNYLPFKLSALALSFFSVALSAENKLPDEIIVITAQAQQSPWLGSASSSFRKDFNNPSLQIDAAALLQQIPGIQADSRANYAQDSRLSARGFGSRSSFGIRGIRLLQDGIPLSSPDGQGQLSSVLLDQLSSVEVLTGPLAVLYGNAAGGVVALQSRWPTENSASVQLSHSQFARQQLLSGALVQGKHATSLSLKNAELQSPRAHSNAKKQQAQWLWQSAFDNELKLQLRYDWSYDPLLQDPLGLTAQEWQDNPRQTAANALTFDTRKFSKQQQWSLNLSQQLDQQSWRLAAWSGQRDVGQYLGFDGAAPTSAGGVIDLSRPYQGLDASYSWQLKQLRLSIGGALEQSTDERRGYVNNQGIQGDLRRDEEGEVQSTDLYSRFVWDVNPHWQLSGGVRHSELDFEVTDFYITAQNPDDSGSTSFGKTSAALALNFAQSEHLSWYISTGQGFETPTFTEMAYQTNGDGLNLGLKESTNQQWELGNKWQQNNWRSSVALFLVESENELVVDRSSGGRTSYRNASETKRTGLELSALWFASASWHHQWTLTQLNASFVQGDLDGKLLPGVAKQQAQWQISWMPFQSSEWMLQLDTLYRSKVATSDQNLLFAPSATLYHLKLMGQSTLSALQLSYWLGLDNLTDKNYVGAVVVNQANGRAFEPALPRSVSMGLSLSF